MSDSAVVFARQEQIDRWVVRAALTTVLHNVANACEIKGGGTEDVEDIPGELDADLFDSLWPTGDDEPGPVANARVDALSASILVRLTTDEARDYLLKEAARLAVLAADQLEKVSDDA
jgi:hypothetical protein